MLQFVAQLNTSCKPSPKRFLSYVSAFDTEDISHGFSESRFCHYITQLLDYALSQFRKWNPYFHQSHPFVFALCQNPKNQLHLILSLTLVHVTHNLRPENHTHRPYPHTLAKNYPLALSNSLVWKKKKETFLFLLLLLFSTTKFLDQSTIHSRWLRKRLQRPVWPLA